MLKDKDKNRIALKSVEAMMAEKSNLRRLQGTHALDPLLFEYSTDSLEIVMNRIRRRPEYTQLLRAMRDDKNSDLYRHSQEVALFSCMMAFHLGWTSPDTLFFILCGGLFHDVGKLEIDQEVLLKSKGERSLGEQAIYESHGLRGVEILRTIPEMSETVLRIVHEHHNYDYQYSSNLVSFIHHTHPFARLVGAADAFYHQAEKSQDLNTETIKGILVEMRRIPQIQIDGAMIACLFSMFRLPVPEDLVEALKIFKAKKHKVA